MWGRELKWSWSRIRSRLALVDLYVRSWIEISLFFMWMLIRQCRPLCEVVNWNYQFVENEGLTFVDLYVRSWIEILMHIMQQRRWAGRSTSMWGRELKFIKNWSKKKQSSSTSMWGRELKYVFEAFMIKNLLSTSMWGRELKSWMVRTMLRWNWVDLYVRSWIEIDQEAVENDIGWSRPLHEVVNWNIE